MKKTKLAVLFSAFVSMIGLSSCLGDPDPIVTRPDYVSVDGGMGFYEFKTAYGATLTPTNQSTIDLGFETKYALVTYKYDSSKYSEVDNKEVECIGVEGFEEKILSSYTNEEDMTANAPVASLTDGYFYSVVFWDKTTMFIPAFYYVKYYENDQTKQQEELDSHNFEIYYNVNDEKALDGELILHLRHTVMDDSNEANTERKNIYHDVFHCDISSALNDYQAAKGGSPKKISVEYEQNTLNAFYEDGKFTSEKVEIDYSKIEQSYEE